MILSFLSTWKRDRNRRRDSKWKNIILKNATNLKLFVIKKKGGEEQWQADNIMEHSTNAQKVKVAKEDSAEKTETEDFYQNWEHAGRTATGAHTIEDKAS